MRPPIFLVGAPRSGTTLMRLLLNAHPSIAIPIETHYFPHIYEPSADGGLLEWSAAIETFLRECAEKFQPPVDLHDVEAELRRLEHPDFGRLLSLPLSAWAARQGKHRWGEKTPRHMFYADDIVEVFPGAKVVVMRRDPRAVVASMNRFTLIATKDCALHARHWRDTWTQGWATVSTAVPEPDLLTVGYEELVLDPDLAVRRVCEFLEEDFHASMLSFHERAPEFVSARKESRILEPVGGDPFAWRSELSPRDVAVVEAICGPTMESLGYAREGRALSLGERAEVAAKMGYVDLKQRQHRRVRHHSVLYSPLGRVRSLGRTVEDQV